MTEEIINLRSLIQSGQKLAKIDRLEQENRQMKSALEEIKNSVINYLPKVNYKFAKSFHPEEFELLESIVNKINEVLNV